MPPTRRSAKSAGARDAYFVCLDAQGLWLDGFKPEGHETIMAIDPTRVVPKSPSDRTLTKEERNSLFTCSKLLEMTKKDCLPSSVVHFGMTRVKELQKQYMVEHTGRKEQDISGSGASAFWEKVSAK
ncbi:hypothetical protein DFJ73DRAFT_824761 [Zopfochytrium polystomum]|nr:hypothetical protein DFJ73DRAFT_824761 [Zopfochytrium polystomum]